MTYTPEMWEQIIANGTGGGGGTGGALYVNVAFDEGTSEVTADKTFAEIEAAYAAGQAIIITMSGEWGAASGLFGRYTADDYVGYAGDIRLLDGSTSILSNYHYNVDAEEWYGDLSKYELTPAN